MRYIVKDTHIRHGNRTYGPGDVIELAEEAAPLLHHLELIDDEVGLAVGSEDSVEEKKGRRK